MGDAPAIRCYTCNTILARHYDDYDNLMAGKPLTPYEAFRKMGIDKLRGKEQPSKTIEVPWVKTLPDGTTKTIMVERKLKQFKTIDLWEMYGSWLTPEVIANVPLEDNTVMLYDIPSMDKLLSDIGVQGLDDSYKWALRDKDTRKALYHISKHQNPQSKDIAMKVLDSVRIGMKAFMRISYATRPSILGCKSVKGKDGKTISARAVCDERNGRKMLTKFIVLTKGERLTNVEALHALGLDMECCRMRMMSKIALPMGLKVPTMEEAEEELEDINVPIIFPMVAMNSADTGAQETMNIPEISALDISELEMSSYDAVMTLPSEAGMFVPVDPLGVSLMTMDIGNQPQGMAAAMPTIDYIEDLGDADLGYDSFMRPFKVKTLRRPPEGAPVRGIRAL